MGTGDKPDRRLHDLGRESGRESGLRFLSQGGDKDRRKIVFFLKVGFYKRGSDIVLKIKEFNGLVVTQAAGFWLLPGTAMAEGLSGGNMA